MFGDFHAPKVGAVALLPLDSHDLQPKAKPGFGDLDSGKFPSEAGCRVLWRLYRPIGCIERDGNSTPLTHSNRDMNIMNHEILNELM